MHTVIQCPRGHFYDRSMYGSCPHCENGLNEGYSAADLRQIIAEEAKKYLEESRSGRTAQSRRPVTVSRYPTGMDILTAAQTEAQEAAVRIPIPPVPAQRILPARPPIGTTEPAPQPETAVIRPTITTRRRMLRETIPAARITEAVVDDAADATAHRAMERREETASPTAIRTAEDSGKTVPATAAPTAEPRGRIPCTPPRPAPTVPTAPAAPAV